MTNSTKSSAICHFSYHSSNEGFCSCKYVLAFCYWLNS